MRTGATLLSAALLAVLAFPAAALAETWDMPTPYADNVFHTQNIRQFADDVREATGGALEITLHSAGSLFPHSEIKNAVRSGQAPIGEIFMSRLENENAVFGLDSQPFLATTYEEAEALWQAQKPVVTELLAEQGLMPLFSVPWPPQGLYTNGKIAGASDLNGVRFRAYNVALEQFATLAGAAPTQIEVPDIPQAFATGRVEAMITSPSTGVSSKSWDFVSHYSPINAWIPKNVVFVNKRAFDRLDEQVQNAVLTAAAAAEARGWALSRDETESKTAELADNGTAVYEPGPALMGDLRTIGTRMLETLEAGASEEARAVLAEFRGQ